MQNLHLFLKILKKCCVFWRKPHFVENPWILRESRDHHPAPLTCRYAPSVEPYGLSPHSPMGFVLTAQAY